MKGLGIGGLVAGIVALVITWFGGWFSIIALPLAIAGLVLSVVGGKKLKAAGQSAGVATAGLVIGIIATVLSSIFFFTCGICVLCVANEIEDAVNDANDILNNL